MTTYGDKYTPPPGGVQGELSEAAQRDVARLLQRIDERRLRDGTAYIDAHGEVVSRELTAEEVASGRYPLAKVAIGGQR